MIDDAMPELPEPLNAADFMMRIIACTPLKMTEVQGIVEVAARLHLDQRGEVGTTELKCSTVSGRPVAPDDSEILEAARTALRELRFAPARLRGVPVPCVYELSFGFTTLALEVARRPFVEN